MQSLSFCAITNRGYLRESNEDNFYAAGLTPGAQGIAETECIRQGTLVKKRECSLFAVCDGMGGMNAGEVASDFVVRVIGGCEDCFISEDAEEGARFLDRFLSEQNENLYALSKTKLELDGLGTTFVGLCIADGEAVAINVGDSRCYLLREGKLHQLTTDHSEAERLLRMGIMTPEQARGSKERTMLYRYIGTSPEVGRLECSVAQKVQIQKGDVFLLCSDGLTDMVNDSMITGILVNSIAPEESARALIDAALQSGGKDNITVVVIKMEKRKK